MLIATKDKESENSTIDTEKVNRYVAIDFETMETWRASVCEIGIAVIENGEVTETFNTYVCPPTKNENKYCVETHGLHYKDVKDYPDFPTLWKEIDEKYIKSSPLIAHNASFERSCINACNEEFETNNDYIYIDTLQLSRKKLNLWSNTLDVVCESLRIPLKHHHRALDDAKACANIFLKLNNRKNKKK